MMERNISFSNRKVGNPMKMGKMHKESIQRRYLYSSKGMSSLCLGIQITLNIKFHHIPIIVIKIIIYKDLLSGKMHSIGNLICCWYTCKPVCSPKWPAVSIKGGHIHIGTPSIPGYML